MHVITVERMLLPLQKDTELYVKELRDNSRSSTPGSHVVLTCSMSAQDIWARKYHELWEKLEKKFNTKDSLIVRLAR